MALTFKEQTELIREGADFLATGRERAEFDNQLYDRGLYKADVDRLGFEIDRELGQRYEADIQAQLERSGSATNNTPLTEAVYADLLRQQKAEFVKRRDARARLLLREGRTPEAIATDLEHPLYSRDEARHTITKELARQEKQQQSDEPAGAGGALLGAVLIGLGVVLGYVFPGRIFYGLILIGIYYLFRGLTR